jgi:hypothetical protein
LVEGAVQDRILGCEVSLHWHSNQGEADLTRASDEVSPDNGALCPLEPVPGFWSQRIHEYGCDPTRLEQARIGDNLVDVVPMLRAGVVG